MKRTSIFLSIYIGLFLLAQVWGYGLAQEKHIYDIDVSATAENVDLVTGANVSQWDGGITPLSNGRVVENVVAASSVQASAVLDSQNGTIPPSLRLFYGPTQEFGQIGNPQTQINVLGNLMTEGNIGTLEYSLNGGQIMTTTLGPDRRRLASAGDFNIEIPYANLNNGANQLSLTARDQFNQLVSSTVNINYTAGEQWPMPYVANWATASTISDVAQVVDGEWALTGSGVKPTVLAYDRLIGMGDSSWMDYEVTVPVTINGIDEATGYRFPSLGPGIGLIMDWGGHFQQADEIPFDGWQEFGAIGWYRWSQTDGVTSAGLQMLTYYGREKATDPSLQLEYAVPYTIKMSSQRQADGTNLYRYKMWKNSEPEPAGWNMIANGDAAAATSGSLLLVAHHVDVEYGTVNVRPLSAIQPKVNLTINGSGTVAVEPNLPAYAYGQIVTVTATAPLGQIVEWDGALQGNTAVQQLTLTGDVNITAKFVSSEPVTLDLSVAGSGKILVSPEQQAYAVGSTVTLTALADDGHFFTGWGGALSGLQNPIQLIVSPGKSVVANFVNRSTLTPPLSDDFNGCELDSSLWTIRDPVGDVTITQNGTQVTIAVPAASDHDLWAGKNFAPRVMQSTNNGDFMAEVKFQSIPSQRFQTQGMIIEQDADNFIRFDVFHDGTELRLFAAIFKSSAAQPTVRYNQPLSTPSGTDILVRVEHFGDRWRLYYSFDGSNWVGPMVNFVHAMTVTQTGFYAGNTADVVEDIPAFESKVDYFYNSLAPITPEDYYANQVVVTTMGSGTGTINLSSPQRGSAGYFCGEMVTLTAQPDSSARFVGWSGNGISSSTNPLSIAITGGMQTVTAEFELARQDIFLPFVVE